jgi:hypothetical protein
MNENVDIENEISITDKSKLCMITMRDFLSALKKCINFNMLGARKDPSSSLEDERSMKNYSENKIKF